MTDKPRLDFFALLNMSFGFFGIQFGWGLQMANMSAIYQYLGAREILSGIRSMSGPMRKLALVQFFTWFALFCMWIYFAPGVARGVFGGAPLAISEAAVAAKLDR